MVCDFIGNVLDVPATCLVLVNVNSLNSDQPDIPFVCAFLASAKSFFCGAVLRGQYYAKPIS
jgi:hypothetical protein